VRQSVIGGRQGAAQKGYLDIELMCSSVGHKVTIRCTRQGIIVCKYPWQKCKPRKENADRDHCVMTRLIEDVPKEAKRVREEQRKDMQEALLTWLVFKRQIK